MTVPVFIDSAALEKLIARMVAIADGLTGVSASVSPVDSSMSRIAGADIAADVVAADVVAADVVAAEKRVTAEVHRLTNALQDWIHNIRRAQGSLAAVDSDYGQRFGGGR